MLLTREERQTLTRDEKRALRKQRREERRADREPPAWLQWDVLQPLARKLILQGASLAMPGPDKMDDIIDDLATDWDKIIKWEWLARSGPVGAMLAPVFEAGDGPALHAAADFLLRPHVQRLYDEMRAEGLIE